MRKKSSFTRKFITKGSHFAKFRAASRSCISPNYSDTSASFATGFFTFKFEKVLHAEIHVIPFPWNMFITPNKCHGKIHIWEN